MEKRCADWAGRDEVSVRHLSAQKSVGLRKSETIVSEIETESDDDAGIPSQ